MRDRLAGGAVRDVAEQRQSLPAGDATRVADPLRAAPPRHALSGLKGRWRGWPVQLKFLAIAIPLIVLLVIAALVVLLEDYYRDQLAKLLLSQKQIAFSQALLLADPLHGGDTTTVTRLLATIIADPAFAGAAVEGPGGEAVATVGDPVLAGDLELRHVEPITYADQRGVVALGQLTIQASDGPIRQAIRARVEHHLMIMAILAFGLAIAVQVAYRQTIGKPLAAMVEAIAAARKAQGPVRIVHSSPDEMGQLAAAFNAHVEREWTYQRELVIAKDHLEARVAARTRELSQALAKAKEASAEIVRLAMEDSLTGLPNRREFANRLGAALAAAERHGGNVAVMMIDLDRFKNINDGLGHGAGDELLRQLAARLRTTVRAENTVARLGGDEFAVLATGLMTGADIAATVRRIAAVLNQPARIAGAEVHPGASIGISVYPENGATGEALMANADIALHRAKDNGRGRFCFFDAGMRAAVARADRIEAELRKALDDRLLELFYQPKIELGTGRLAGFEALLRWQNAPLGPISPVALLAVAEDRGLMYRVGRAVIERATADLADWLAAGHDPGTIAINLHPMELRRRDHLAGLLEIIRGRGLALDRFVFEITEDCVIGRGTEEAISLLTELRARGLALSLDDFGTGYASLKHLKDLPVDEIKIDGGFVADMVDDASAAAIVRATIDLARSLDLRVVAEGIETEQQIGLLQGFTGVIGQGFALGRPSSADETEALLAASRPRMG